MDRFDIDHPSTVCVVISRDLTALDNARGTMHLVHDDLADLTTDIVEVDVWPLGNTFRQLLGEVLDAIAESGVEAQFFGENVALSR